MSHTDKSRRKLQSPQYCVIFFHASPLALTHVSQKTPLQLPSHACPLDLSHASPSDLTDVWEKTPLQLPSQVSPSDLSHASPSDLTDVWEKPPLQLPSHASPSDLSLLLHQSSRARVVLQASSDLTSISVNSQVCGHLP